MVRIATSIAAVTLLAGTALAQGYYDEQFERSLADSESIEARSEAALGDYLAARDELEEQYGREITDNERRELFEALEERDPELFALFDREYEGDELEARDFEELEQREPQVSGALRTVGVGLLHKARQHQHYSGGHGGATFHHAQYGQAIHRFGQGGHSGFSSPPPPQNNRREYVDGELEARDFEDLEEFEARDFEELEQREPQVSGALRTVGVGLLHKARQHQQYNGGRGGVAHHFGQAHHFAHGGHSGFSQPPPQTQNNNRREFFDDAEELEMREFDDELDARGLRSWVKSKFHRKQKQQGAPGGEEYPPPQYRREFDDAEELEMREFDEDFEDVLARDYDYFDELD